ncbi:MAG: hypothetical protein HY600_02590 [Candidatus Omnitrophica bacterium]|nr:hypothetical protein [Candidatus Omnitrophota bacterium]
MTPTARRSLSRWLARLLLLPLASTAAPTPAFALRAAGLEENSAHDELTEQLKQLSSAASVGNGAPTAVSPQLHERGRWFVTRLFAPYIASVRRGAGITPPERDLKALYLKGVAAPHIAAARRAATGLEESWEQDVAALLDYYEATKAMHNLPEAPSSATIRQALERQDVAPADKEASVESAVDAVLNQQLPYVQQQPPTSRWDARAALTRPLHTIILIFQHPTPDHQGEATSLALHLIEAYEDFRTSAQPALFGTAVPDLSPVRATLRARRLDEVRTQVETAARAVSSANLSLDMSLSSAEAQVREAAFRQFQTVLRAVLNKALAVLPATGLEEATELALERTQELLGVAPPVGATHGVWVPASPESGARGVSFGLFYLTNKIFLRDVPDEVMSATNNRFVFLPNPNRTTPVASDVALALYDTEMPMFTPSFPVTIRFAQRVDVQTLRVSAVRALVANATASSPLVVFWSPASATPVKIDGREGYLFYA